MLPLRLYPKERILNRKDLCAMIFFQSRILTVVGEKPINLNVKKGGPTEVTFLNDRVKKCIT